MQTISLAAAALRTGKRSPLDLLENCLQRIDRLEERVRAWVSVDREGSRETAERLTAELRAGHDRGPLHGIPIAVKDIIDVADWPTAAGSRRWAQSIARNDAPVVRRLRQAGAVVVGKTVTTHFASFDPPPTRNPWNLERTPGGSSSGSAAAVACGMCYAALGTQTGGSIVRPASYCGVVGVKPTYGRASTTGVLPLAASMDHVGSVARCVADGALILQTIAGPDPADPTCADRPVPDYLARLAAIGPPRLGRVRGLFADLADAAVRAMMDETVELLRRQGATVVDVALPAGFAEVVRQHRIVMGVESAAFHEPRLRRHPEDYLPNFRSLVEEGLACPGLDYARAKEHQRELTAAMAGCFDGVDALLTPATTTPAPPADTTGNPAFNSPWSYTGLPTVSVPAGRAPDGLPLSLQLIGRAWDETTVFATAAWCESRLSPLGEPPIVG